MIGNPYPQFQNVQEWNDFVNEVRHYLEKFGKTLDDLYLEVQSGSIIYTLPPATESVLGGVMVGSGLDVTSTGLLSVPVASASVRGGVKVGNGLTMTGDVLSADGYTLPTASSSIKGGVMVGSGLTMTGDVLSADGYNLPTASSSIKGGVMVGSGLTMTGDVLSADSYTLPTASSSIKGGVKVGSGLTITGDVLSADGYNLPTASESIKGGVKVGAGLVMTGEVLSVIGLPELADVSSVTATAGDSTATIQWTDPADVVLSGSMMVRWAGTKLVRKAGSAPASITDGTLVIDSTTRDVYSSSGLVDTGLTNGTTYYYRFFPYATSGAVTEGQTQSVTPHVVQAIVLSNPYYYTMQQVYPNDYLTMTTVTDRLDVSNLSTLEDMFSPCPCLTQLDLSTVGNFSSILPTSVAKMFMNCGYLTTLDLSGLDVSNTSNFSAIFSGCSSLTTLDISDFDTSSGTDFKQMFYNCSSLTTLTATFDLSSITDKNNLAYMFNGTQLTSVTFKNVPSAIQSDITTTLLGLPSNATINFT